MSDYTDLVNTLNDMRLCYVLPKYCIHVFIEYMIGILIMFIIITIIGFIMNLISSRLDHRAINDCSKCKYKIENKKSVKDR